MTSRRGTSGASSVIASGPRPLPDRSSSLSSLIAGEATSARTPAIESPFSASRSSESRRSRGEDVDPDELQRAIEDATTAVIAAQVDAGIDIGNDGEQARESFVTYVQHRMTGFGGTSQRPLMRDLQDAITEVDATATLAALPDAMSGHRLAGSAADPAGLRAALQGRGTNPLLVNAFLARPPATGAVNGPAPV